MFDFHFLLFTLCEHLEGDLSVSRVPTIWYFWICLFSCSASFKKPCFMFDSRFSLFTFKEHLEGALFILVVPTICSLVVLLLLRRHDQCSTFTQTWYFLRAPGARALCLYHFRRVIFLYYVLLLFRFSKKSRSMLAFTFSCSLWESLFRRESSLLSLFKPFDIFELYFPAFLSSLRSPVWCSTFTFYLLFLKSTWRESSLSLLFQLYDLFKPFTTAVLPPHRNHVWCLMFDFRFWLFTFWGHLEGEIFASIVPTVWHFELSYILFRLI